MHNIAILASGSGSNAEAIINYFSNHDSIKVALVLSNRKSAYVLERAQNHDITALHFSKEVYQESDSFLETLERFEIDYIVLAGFLKLIPSYLIEAFPDRIINIHPALLPKYGGKGMYGMHVHEAVKKNGEAYSGMTIHLVNEHFDEGRILFQDKVKLEEKDTAQEIASKVLKLEHKHYPEQIERWIKSDTGIVDRH